MNLDTSHTERNLDQQLVSPSRQVKSLADSLLSQKERKLAKRLATLLGNERYDAGSLIVEILPKYWRRDNTEQSLEPREVYRPLYYLHEWAYLGHFSSFTRSYIQNAFQHLEGCLSLLVEHTPGIPRSLRSKPLGTSIKGLEESGVLPSPLAKQLLDFNSMVNVPAKHMKAAFLNPELDKRTFSILDAALVFVMTRKLSMEIFQILRMHGIIMPQQWKNFNEKWLTWSVKSEY